MRQMTVWGVRGLGGGGYGSCSRAAATGNGAAAAGRTRPPRAGRRAGRGPRTRRTPARRPRSIAPRQQKSEHDPLRPRSNPPRSRPRFRRGAMESQAAEGRDPGLRLRPRPPRRQAGRCSRPKRIVKKDIADKAGGDGRRSARLLESRYRTLTPKLDPSAKMSRGQAAARRPDPRG